MTSESLRIRPIRDQDLPKVVELWKTVFPDDPPWNDPRIMAERKMELEPELFLVGELEGRLVAAVMAGYDGVRGWIYHLAVAPDLRRRGLGRKMVETAEDMLVALRCPKVNLQIRSSNEDVVRFYRAMGYDLEDRVSMGKRLEP
jgi:ribosomal protein S18 acetylase RimI-like enzyme